MSNREITRRSFIENGIGAAAVVTSALIPSKAFGTGAEPELTEDGLHYQPWFLESFLELGDDLTSAAAAGKHFAVLWELKGCPYCKETHMVNFANDKISSYIKANFEILQLNIIGSKLVTDFDGEELPEKAIAKKYSVRYTPTIQFFPGSIAGLDESSPKKREIGRLPGYVKPAHFLSMFQYIAEKSYKSMSFRQYVKALKP